MGHFGFSSNLCLIHRIIHTAFLKYTCEHGVICDQPEVDWETRMGKEAIHLGGVANTNGEWGRRGVGKMGRVRQPVKGGYQGSCYCGWIEINPTETLWKMV